MRSRELVGLFSLGCLVPLWDAMGLPGVLPGASRAALALLPWFALAVRPGPVTEAEAEDRFAGRRLDGALSAVAFLLPPLALGVGLDLAAGFEASALAQAVAASLAMLALWGAGQRLARRGARAATAYGLLWWCALPCSAGLWIATQWVPWVPSSSAGARPIALWAAANPLVFTHAWGASGALGEALPEWAGLLGGLFALFSTRLFAGPEREARS